MILGHGFGIATIWQEWNIVSTLWRPDSNNYPLENGNGC
jgi:hypothetical protein